MAFWLVGVWHSRRSARSLVRTFSILEWRLLFAVSPLGRVVSFPPEQTAIKSYSLSLSLSLSSYPPLGDHSLFSSPKFRSISMRVFMFFFPLFWIRSSPCIFLCFLSVVSNAKFFLFSDLKSLVFQSAQESPSPSSSRDRKPKSKRSALLVCVLAHACRIKLKLGKWKIARSSD